MIKIWPREIFFSGKEVGGGGSRDRGITPIAFTMLSFARDNWYAGLQFVTAYHSESDRRAVNSRTDKNCI